jgi:hypothetical protein
VRDDPPPSDSTGTRFKTQDRKSAESRTQTNRTADLIADLEPHGVAAHVVADGGWELLEVALQGIAPGLPCEPRQGSGRLVGERSARPLPSGRGRRGVVGCGGRGVHDVRHWSSPPVTRHSGQLPPVSHLVRQDVVRFSRRQYIAELWDLHSYAMGLRSGSGRLLTQRLAWAEISRSSLRSSATAIRRSQVTKV